MCDQELSPSPNFHSEALRKWANNYAKALEAAHNFHQCNPYLRDDLTSTPSQTAKYEVIPRLSQHANDKSLSEESIDVKLSSTLTTANVVS